MRITRLPFMLVAILSVTLEACAPSTSQETLFETQASLEVAPNSGVATVKWVAPTQNDDDTPLTDLARYRLHYGTSRGVYTTTIDVGNVTNYTVTNLAVGHTYYFAVSAVNVFGDESPLSNIGSKRVD